MEGGKRENALVEYFRNLAAKNATKWPVTASILKNIAKHYEAEAKREDARAEQDGLEY